MKQAYTVYFFAVAIIIVAAVAIGTIGIHKQKRHIYVLPSGYTGWVQVIYNQKDSPELPKEGKAILHEIPRDGILHTSSPPTSGNMSFYFVDNQGKRSEVGTDWIHGQSIGTKDVKLSNGATEQTPVNSFFVGTEQQYNDEISKANMNPVR